MSHARQGSTRRWLETASAAVIGLGAVSSAVYLFAWQYAHGEPAHAHSSVGRLFDLLILGVESAGSIAAAMLGLVLIWRRSRQSGARDLALFLLLLGWAMASDGVWVFLQVHTLPTAAAWLLDKTTPAAIVFMTAAFLRFSALFPEPLRAASVRDRIQGESVWTRLQLATLRPGVVWSAAALVLLALIAGAELQGAWDRAHGGHNSLAVVKPVAIALVLAALVLGTINLRAGYRLADAAGRRRMYWVLEGFVLAVGTMAVATLIKGVQMVSGTTTALNWYVVVLLVAFFALLVCLAVAMFFSGALDPELVVRRTAVYTLVGVVLVFLFAGVENVIHEHLKEWLGLSDTASGVLMGGTVALAAEPVKHRVGALVERALARRGIAPVRAHPDPALVVAPVVRDR